MLLTPCKLERQAILISAKRQMEGCSVFGFFRKNREEKRIARLYARIVKRARHPDFYQRVGVPDTLDGRFDVLALHVHLYLRALRRHDLGREALGQGLFDAFFADLDQGLREGGVGDLSVSKKIKRMAEAFYGRAAAYDAAFNATQPDQALADVIDRNIMSEEKLASSLQLAHYVVAFDQALALCSVDDIMAGAYLEEPLSHQLVQNEPSARIK